MYRHTTFPITSAFTRVEMNYYLSKHLRPKQYVIDSVNTTLTHIDITHLFSFSCGYICVYIG